MNQKPGAMLRAKAAQKPSEPPTGSHSATGALAGTPSLSSSFCAHAPLSARTSEITNSSPRRKGRYPGDLDCHLIISLLPKFCERLFLSFFALEEVEGRHGIKCGREKAKEEDSWCKEEKGKESEVAQLCPTPWTENRRGSGENAGNKYGIWKTRVPEKEKRTTQQGQGWCLLQRNDWALPGHERHQGRQGGSLETPGPQVGGAPCSSGGLPGRPAEHVLGRLWTLPPGRHLLLLRPSCREALPHPDAVRTRFSKEQRAASSPPPTPVPRATEGIRVCSQACGQGAAASPLQALTGGFLPRDDLSVDGGPGSVT